MYDSVIGGIRETLSQKHGVNSKIELKIQLLNMAQYIGFSYDELMEKFKDEYDSLPLTDNDSVTNSIADVIPMFTSILENFKEDK